jgi:hypothetical protein
MLQVHPTDMQQAKKTEKVKNPHHRLHVVHTINAIS